MVKLHGAAISNYYSKVRISLLEKGVEFEEVLAAPSQDETYLAKSYMGKIPCLEHNGEFIFESAAMIEYIEEVFSETPSLYPENALERARCRELLNITDLYIDLPLRPFFDDVVNEQTRPASERWPKALKTVEKAAGALQRLVKFKPFAMGEQLTYADCSAFATWTIPGRMVVVTGDKNPLESIDGFSEYLKMLGERDHFKSTIKKRKVLQRAQAMGKKRGR